MTDSPLASTEWAGFVNAIRFAPAEDTVRLVAADWLQETAVPELEAWAKFIRLQIAAAREVRLHAYTDSCDCAVCRPERKAVMLFDRWGSHWSWHQFGTSSRRHQFSKASDHARGFLCTATMTINLWKVAEVAGDVSPLFDRCPLQAAMVRLLYGRNSWDLRIDVNAPRAEFIGVVARIQPHPAALTKSVQSSRIVAPHNNFDRAVRGAIRSVIAKRAECFDREPTGLPRP